jgi:hypothetical protein
MGKKRLVAARRKHEARAMKTSQNFFRLTGTLAVAAIIFLAAGCATSPKNSGPKYAFFPPPPDAPRLQFLAAFGSEKDLRGRGGDTFKTFITGEEPPNTPILKPYGAAATTNNIYICDTGAGLILRMSLAARKIYAIAPTGPGMLKSPVNLSVDNNGWLYIARPDCHSGRQGKFRRGHRRKWQNQTARRGLGQGPDLCRRHRAARRSCFGQGHARAAV